MESKQITGIHVIGDVDGSFEIFCRLLETSGVINQDGDCLNGKNPIVILGDILGERSYGAIEIFDIMRDLRDRSNSIISIAGNHDEIAIGCLLGQSINNGCHEILSEAITSRQVEGLSLSSVITEKVSGKYSRIGEHQENDTNF